MPVITVSQLNRYLSSIFRGDRNLTDIVVKGEITNVSPFFKGNKSYIFFSLSDDESLIGAVMFTDAVKHLKFRPQNGMAVVVHGKVNVYEKNGTYRIIVSDMIPEGAGKELSEFEKLKEKLSKEGIFSPAHKRPLPRMPKKIGAVTSLRGAAIRDIINVLSRRYPICEVYAVNAQVQGEGAERSICEGIARAESAGCDVIIIGRGGGSSEDLSAFNSELVVRAVYNCRVPVISAVGHETDMSLTDFAADVRAATPSVAAELSSPDIRTFYEHIDILENRMKSCAVMRIDKFEEKYKNLNLNLLNRSPENNLRIAEERLKSLETRNNNAVERYIERLESAFNKNVTKLETLSPLKVLTRGYSLVYKDNKLVRKSEEVAVGDDIELKFSNGTAKAKITEIGD